jgi:hypothetical protein
MITEVKLTHDLNLKLLFVEKLYRPGVFLRRGVGGTRVVPRVALLLAGLSQQRSGFQSGPVDVGFVLDKGANGQISVTCILCFPPSVSIHECSTLTDSSPTQLYDVGN